MKYTNNIIQNKSNNLNFNINQVVISKNQKNMKLTNTNYKYIIKNHMNYLMKPYKIYCNNMI